MTQCPVCDEEMVEVPAGDCDDIGIVGLPGFDCCARCGYDARYDWMLAHRPDELKALREGQHWLKPYPSEIPF